LLRDGLLLGGSALFRRHRISFGCLLQAFCAMNIRTARQLTWRLVSFAAAFC
jgi:hypothetical protein